MTREFEADFATGSVQDASFTARPDAVVGRKALAPGPRALQDLGDGLKVKGWYARYDNDAGKVWLAEAADDTRLGWRDETELFTYSGDDIDALSLAFDATGRPVVAMERAGDLWVRYHDGSSYQLTDLGAGTSPALLHQAPDSSAWRVLYLLYESGSDIKYRLSTDDYATATDTLSNLATDQRIERVILDDLNRVHLILSNHVPSTGRYDPPDRITSEFVPPCMDVLNSVDRIDDGIQTIFIWTGDGELLVTCELEFDVLIIAEGGDSGGSDGQDSVFWASLDGVALNPNTDTPPEEHQAFGGGAGASDDFDGNSGGSGGAGGGESPSQHMWTVGGHGVPGQGHNAGGGRSSWGLLDRKSASSGGGGGYGSPGRGGTFEKAGHAGLGGKIPGWNWSGPKGGQGHRVDGVGDTGPQSGGGGAGGVLTVDGIIIQPAQAIPIRVGGDGNPGGGAGTGGRSVGGPGSGGVIAIRVNTAAEGTPAVLSGGVEVVSAGYVHHIFTSSGTIVVTTPGSAEALIVGGGAGGGSDCGAGGGGGDVRVSIINFVAPSEVVTVGAGGAAGSGGAAGENGEDSSVGNLASAKGGGGGAGEGTAAGSRATGGGGHGVGGDPGAGSPLRGYPGGVGGGFDLSAGGSAASAGGGGGAAGEGDYGAEAETQGDELEDHWEVPTAGTLMLADREYRIMVGGSDEATLIGTDVAVEAMLVQGRVMRAHTSLESGVMARARHPTGDPDEVATGYHASVSNNTFDTSAGSVAYFTSLSTWHYVQVYAEDDVQEYSIVDAEGENLTRLAGTDAGENGNVRSFGFRSKGILPTGTNKQGFCDDLMCFKGKYLEVGNLSAGDYVEVLDLNGVVIATAVESSGTALVDVGMYGLTEPTPLAGWGECVVRNSGGDVVAQALGSFYPGGEFDVSGESLEIRVDSSGPEPVPVTGVLQWSDFGELTPGPENGDGGLGRELAVSWLAAVPGDDGVFGGGGGGGAEIVLAGEGGDGGGGGGSVDTDSPTAGTAETGGGGGGSGDAATPGAAGGSGLVVVRTEITMPPGAEIPTSGLVAHHDAKRITALSDGDVVTTWDDETAEGNDLSNNGSPRYRDGGHGLSIQGWPCVEMSASNFLDYASAFLSGNTEGEVFVVLKNDEDGSRDDGIWQFNTPNNAARHPWLGGSIYETWGRALQLNVGNPAFPLTGAHLYHVKSVPGEYTVRLNTTQLYTSGVNTPQFTDVNPTIGRSDGSTYYKGLWGHLLVYDRELTPAERTKIEDYLTWYWSLDY